MADVDILRIDVVVIAESSTGQGDDVKASVNDAASVAESKSIIEQFEINKSDAITVAENVSTPTKTFTLYRGTNSVSVTALNADWALTTAYKQFVSQGIPLKGIILIPGSGGPDTFSIKDGSDEGSYLYKSAVSAATVLVYPGSYCKPYIDYSECTLSTGHIVTFVW